MNSILSFVLFRVYLEIVLGYHSLRILGALNNRLYYFHGLYYFYSYLQEHGFVPYCATAARCTLVRACLSEVLQRIIHSNSPPKTSDSLQFCGTIDHGSTHLAAIAQIRMRPALKTV